MIEINSAQNQRIKHLLALQQKSALRREEGLFVVEGRRELEHCLQAGMQVDSIYCLNPDEVTSYLSSNKGVRFRLLPYRLP